MNPNKLLPNFLLLFGLAITIVACQPATPTVIPTVTPTATITPTPTATPLPPNVLTSSNCSNIDIWARIGKGRINQMLYTPDGASLLIASAGGIELYDANQAKLLWNGITKDGISQIAIDTDSQRILAIDTKKTLHLLDMKNGKQLNSAEQGDKFMALALAENGKRLASADFDGAIHQYDAEEFKQKGVIIKGPGTSPDAMLADSFYLFMRYSPNEKYIAVATLRAEIYVYDTNNGSLVHKIKPLDPDYDHRIFPEHVAFSQDEKMIAIEYANGQTLVTKTTGNQPGKLLEGSFPSLSADGSTLALKTSKGIELFQTPTGNSLGSLVGTEAALGDSIFSPKSQSLAIVMPGKMTFWDAKELSLTQTIQTTFSDYQAIAISRDGGTLAASIHQLIELYQTKNGDRRTLESQHPVQFLEFSANDSVLVVAGSAWLSVWDPKQSKMIREMELPADIQSMDVSDDGQMAVAVMTDNVTVLYNLSTGQGKNLSESSQKIASATFVDNTNILALDKDQEVYVSTSQNPTFTNIKGFEDVAALMASDRKSLITFATNAEGNSKISIYDIAKQKFLESPLENKSIFALSPVNNIVAIPDNYDSILTLMDINHSDKSCEIKDFSIAAKQMIFSADGQYLFVNGENGIIYIFGIGTRNKNG